MFLFLSIIALVVFSLLLYSCVVASSRAEKRIRHFKESMSNPTGSRHHPPNAPE